MPQRHRNGIAHTLNAGDIHAPILLSAPFVRDTPKVDPTTRALRQRKEVQAVLPAADELQDSGTDPFLSHIYDLTRANPHSFAQRTSIDNVDDTHQFYSLASNDVLLHAL